MANNSKRDSRGQYRRCEGEVAETCCPRRSLVMHVASGRCGDEPWPAMSAAASWPRSMVHWEVIITTGPPPDRMVPTVYDSPRWSPESTAVLGGPRLPTAVLGGPRWLMMVLAGSRWSSVIYSDHRWSPIIYRDPRRSPITYSGPRRSPITYSGPRWSLVTYSGPRWSPVDSDASQ